MVLDADGLNAHAGGSATSRQRPRRPCSRRTRASSGACSSSTAREIERERLRHVRAAAASRRSAVVVLKGDDTLSPTPRRRGRGQPGRQPRARDGGHRRRPHRRDRGAARPGPRRVRGGRRRRAGCTRAPGSEAARRRRARAEGVIASDVIAALPGAAGGRARCATSGPQLRRRRRERRGRSTAEATRERMSAAARAGQRQRRGDRAQLRAPAHGAARGTALCAVVKADGYGHGAVAVRPRGARRRRELAGGRRAPREARELREAGLATRACS